MEVFELLKMFFEKDLVYFICVIKVWLVVGELFVVVVNVVMFYCGVWGYVC